MSPQSTDQYPWPPGISHRRLVATPPDFYASDRTLLMCTSLLRPNSDALLNIFGLILPADHLAVTFGTTLFNIRARAYTNLSYRFLHKQFGDRPFRLLDIGSGNQSATKITNAFPNCEYYGLDNTTAYNYTAEDFRKMKQFFEIDLTRSQLEEIPNAYFDVLWMVHVIEHLEQGEKVLEALLHKLKPGGYFYLEYPGEKSTKLPSMRGTLNFYDDPTHVRVYRLSELRRFFTDHNCTILSSGTRRNWVYIVATPFRVAASILRGKPVEGNLFWDILGFAEYLWVRKNP
jgi:SAM-dependent methyltransferase